MLGEIIKITQGEIGPSISNHLSISKIKKVNCFVTIETSNKERKTLELGTPSEKLMSEFVKDLKLIWEAEK